MARVRSRSGRALEWAAGTLLRPWLARPALDAAQVLRERPSRLLVVRCHDQLGDTVCALPVLQALQELFPAARLTVACLAAQEPLFRHHPAVDEVLPLDHGRLNRSLHWANGYRRRLRAVQPDGAFVLNSVSFSTTSALVAAFSGARWIVGSDAGDLGWTFPRWLYSLCLPFAPDPAGPAVGHALAPLRAAGFPLVGGLPRVRTSAEDEKAGAAFLGPLGHGARVAVHPGAGKPANRWPAGHYARLILALESRGAAVWLVEGPLDRQASEEVIRKVGHDLPLLRCADLCTVAAALRQSDAVVGNDTGILHLAGAAGARGVALFGPTDSAIWAPASPAIRSIQSPDGSMAAISVEAVLAALEPHMESGDATRAPAP